MTEFTKQKMGFALALLGTLFALHPFLDRFDERGFLYLGYDLRVVYAYSLTAGLLSLCVYLYGLTMLGDRPHSWLEHAGNHTYALAILVVPIYGALFLSAKLADWVALSHVAWAAPAVAAGSGVLWIALSQLVAWRIRRRLGDRDRRAKLAQLAKQEVESIRRAREMFDHDHFDLSVVEAWRAMESRLRQALLHRRIHVKADAPDALIHVAMRKGLLDEPTLAVVEELRRHWAVAVGTDPLPRESAVESLSIVRHVLAVVPAEPPARHGARHREGAYGRAAALSTR